MSLSQQPPAERPVPDSSQTKDEDEGEVPATSFDTTETCPECSGTSFSRSDSGEWYCDVCGIVLTATEIEFTEPGWTPRDQRRTGPGSPLSRLTVGTIIGDTRNGSTPQWATYNTRLEHKEETLRHGLREVRAVAAKLEATEHLTERAAYLFRRAATEGLLVGQSIEAVAAACLHATSRENGTPLPLKQVVDVSPVAVSDIKSAFSKLLRAFDLQVVPPTPTVFIPRFASEAGLSAETQRRAMQITDALVDDEGHVGQSPTGVAAAALYGAAQECDEDITQEELASVAYVSVVTLSRQWQTIKEYADSSRT